MGQSPLLAKGSTTASPKKREVFAAGAIAATHHIRSVALHYGVPLCCTDHCVRKLIILLDGDADEDERSFEEHSSHCSAAT